MKSRIIIVSGILMLLSSVVSLHAQNDTAPDQKYDPLEFSDRILDSEAVANLDPVSLADCFDKSPFKIFDYVRDSIRFEAYPGSLRGAKGTLIAGAGNSYDQAILLKTALDSINVQTKLLRGRLPRHLAAELVQNMYAHSAECVGLEKSLENIFNDISENTRAAVEEAHNSAVKNVVEKALKAASQDAAALQLEQPDGESEELVDQTVDYLWVRMTIGGRQYDLHPAFPEGRKIAVEELGVMDYITSMPMELHHWVRLRLFAERIVEDGLQRFLVLENRVLPAAVAGKRVSISLRPESSGDRVTLRPVVRTGDLLFSGDELSVLASDGSARPGALTSLWLEISVLSPFQRPRTETITLADAFPATPNWRKRDEKPLGEMKTLPDAMLNVQTDLMVVSGSLSQAVCLEQGALALRRTINTSNNVPLGNDTIEAIRTANPLLLQWAYMLCPALSSEYSPVPAYIDSPAVAVVIYLPSDSESKSQVKVMTGLPHFSATPSSEAQQPSGLPGILASRLLQELAGQSAPDVAHAERSKTYKKGESGDVSMLSDRGWDWSSLNELEFDLLRRSTVYYPEIGEEIMWWRLSSDAAQPVLRGPEGWVTTRNASIGYPNAERLFKEDSENKDILQHNKNLLRQLLNEQLGVSDISPFTAVARSLLAEGWLDVILVESGE